MASTPDSTLSRLSRRRFLELTGMSSLALTAACSTPAGLLDTELGIDTGEDPDACVQTSTDIEGPFWIEGVPVRTNLDLYADPGMRLAISGKVLATDHDCAPLANAVVEIWHANDAGAYDNDSPELRYRGQTATDAEGRWSFNTIKPGWYLNGSQYRPSHIHVKIHHQGVELLTTQLYFEGDPYLEDDPWAEESRVMSIKDREDGSLACSYTFNVLVEPITP